MRIPPFCWLAVTSLIGMVCAQESGQQAEMPSFGTTVVAPGGLRGTVYAIPQDTTVLPDFERDRAQRIGEIWTDTLNISPHHWRSGFPGLTNRFEWFAIDYQGRFWVEEPGRYVFALISDDGSRLFLDDIPAIDNDCQHPPDLRISAVRMTGGVHRIRICYFQGPRDCIALVLAMAGPDRRWRLFSTKALKPPENPADWHYPEASSVALVPTTPQETALAISDLLQQLGDQKPEGKRNSKANRSCLVPPVRTCAR